MHDVFTWHVSQKQICPDVDLQVAKGHDDIIIIVAEEKERSLVPRLFPLHATKIQGQRGSLGTRLGRAYKGQNFEIGGISHICVLKIEHVSSTKLACL